MIKETISFRLLAHALSWIAWSGTQLFRLGQIHAWFIWTAVVRCILPSHVRWRWLTSHWHCQTPTDIYVGVLIPRIQLRCLLLTIVCSRFACSQILWGRVGLLSLFPERSIDNLKVDEWHAGCDLAILIYHMRPSLWHTTKTIYCLTVFAKPRF